MEMEEDSLDLQDVERAKSFWAKENVDQVFTGVFEYLDNLKNVLKNKTATDKQYVQGLKLLEIVDSYLPDSPPDSSVVQVVIGLGPGEVLLHDSLQGSSSSCTTPHSNGPSSPAASPAGREQLLLRPLTPVQLQCQLHTCCKTCLSNLPSMHQFMPPFWGQNPLKIPLLCGFKRLTAVPLMSLTQDGDGEGAGPAGPSHEEDWDVLYKAPCGQSLRNYDNVMHFLSTTDSHDILQVDFFTFNPHVRLDPPTAAGPKCPELDLSRGLEPTPVQLCPGEGGAHPPEFRYRKDRWPHGCFLSRGPRLFRTYCVCTDGCRDSQQCPCISLTTRGRHYSHHRLEEPVPSGLYECGPWCGCDWARCQNRLVQRGIRVRLQVFKTDNRGWGVRCRDDLDRGTFVCIYAGVVLQKVQSPTNPPSPKMTRMDLPSDDEVEIVTEWLVPQVQEGRSNLVESTSPPLHVPVIQRSADASAATTTPKDQDKKVLVGGPDPPSPPAGGSCDHSQAENKKPVEAGAVSSTETESSSQRSLKRVMNIEDAVIVDASKEGNVSRFINHSCQPNLFIQHIFIDSHDPSFPVIAFFTKRVLKAGTELTWNYSSDAGSKQEIPCQCGSDDCRGHFAVGNPYDIYEMEAEPK
ncbi:histone-lysine N-methyltransferase SETDB2-like isoform X1 [Antennarius striatus]|uniref:histone-lysine N-methyltransferase SETDB2-like isoform X1 n=1 Tax=Antennarius striatus TaxID=241820 RepID=UPI0035ADB70C